MATKANYHKAKSKNLAIVAEPELLGYSLPILNYEKHLRNILEFLGGKNIIRQDVKNELDLIGLAEQGIPKKSLENI